MALIRFSCHVLTKHAKLVEGISFVMFRHGLPSNPFRREVTESRRIYIILLRGNSYFFRFLIYVTLLRFSPDIRLMIFSNNSMEQIGHIISRNERASN